MAFVLRSTDEVRKFFSQVHLLFIFAETRQQRIELLNGLLTKTPEPAYGQSITYIIGDNDKEVFSHSEPFWVRRDSDSYLSALKSVSRCDPEAIIINEMPDELWEMVWTLYETGTPMIATAAGDLSKAEQKLLNQLQHYSEKVETQNGTDLLDGRFSSLVQRYPVLLLCEGKCLRLKIEKKKFILLPFEMKD